MENGKLSVEFLGANCVDCAIVLKGRENSDEASVCRMIYRALRNGEAQVMLDGKFIVFVAGGISFKFMVPEKKLKGVASLITYGNICLEPVSDGIYNGFEISRNC